jgi:O-6-methylguanine DNA methyltransferase
MLRYIRQDRSALEGEPVVGRYETPWGSGTVTVHRGRLIGVELPWLQSAELQPIARGGSVLQNASTDSEEGRQHELSDCDRAAMAHWIAELEAYFRGERLGWLPDEVSLEDLGLGDFERSVYEALLGIPPGITVSYGVLAKMAGYPRAARAVGNAMAANPLPVVVPCHRVIRADGSLGKYGRDPAWKVRLLDHERTHVSPLSLEDSATERGNPQRRQENA